MVVECLASPIECVSIGRTEGKARGTPHHCTAEKGKVLKGEHVDPMVSS